MCECYSKVRDWREVVNWDTRVETMKKQHVEMESAFRLHCNIEQIKSVLTSLAVWVCPCGDSGIRCVIISASVV